MPRLGTICTCGHAYIAHSPSDTGPQPCIFCECRDFKKAERA